MGVEVVHNRARRFFRCTYVGAVPGGLKLHQGAVFQVLVQVGAHFGRGKAIVGALQNEAAGVQLSQFRRVSEKKVTSAKCRAMAGFVRQKLTRRSSANSGSCGLPMTMGASAAAQAK